MRFLPRIGAALISGAASLLGGLGGMFMPSRPQRVRQKKISERTRYRSWARPEDYLLRRSLPRGRSSTLRKVMRAESIRMRRRA